jgi:multidrug efflux system membrane fusion protein
MRKTVAVFVAIIVAAVSWAVYTYSGDRASAAQAPVIKPAVPVTAGVAETRDMPVYANGIGTVQAYNTVTVKSRVDGQIVKVDFTEGQEVKAGDPLFEIDPRPYQAALEQAVANKEKDEAQLASAMADLKRDSQLLGRGFQTQQAYGQQKALVGQLQAAIKADKAQIDTARLNLQYATLRSPIDGRTGARQLDVGNLVHAADNVALVTIAQLRPIFVSFTLPQNDLEAIREGESKAPLKAEAYTQDNRKELGIGKLTLIDNRIDQATGTLHLKAQFANQKETLWPGELVKVRLIVRMEKNAVTVPATSIQLGPSGDYVFVIKPDDTVEIRAVEVAQTQQNVAVIRKGLAAGERIVVAGQYRLDQGTKVAVERPLSAGKS